MAENYLGGICLRQGDLPQAVVHTRQALSYWEQVGYSWGVANTLNNLGILEVTGGNIAAALINFEASLRLRRDMGDVEGLAIAYNNLGQLLRDQGDLEQAEHHFRDSLLLTRSLRMNFHSATSFIGLAQVLIYLGRLEEAGEQLEYGRVLAQGLNAPDLSAERLLCGGRAKDCLAGLLTGRGDHSPGGNTYNRIRQRSDAVRGITADRPMPDGTWGPGGSQADPGSGAARLPHRAPGIWKPGG